MERRYRVGEFAALTGVTIRALHHYDRIGLLRPSAYTDGNQRLYAESDLLRLQQILTLRYLGFPLGRIREVLETPDFDILAALRVQRAVLRDRIAELERVESVLGEVIEQRQAGGRWSWDVLVRASNTVQTSLMERREKMSGQFTPEQMRQFEDLGREIGTAERERIERDWTALIADVRANQHLAPASPEARALADRWNALMTEIQGFYAKYPGLWEAIGENYRQGNFEGHDQAPQAADFEFINRVNAARGS